VGEGYRFRVTDTVGFIRKLPHHLVASFRATLEETREADLLLHVIDASQNNWDEQARIVEETIGGMRVRGAKYEVDSGERNGNGNTGAALQRTVYVFNKADLLPDPDAFLTQVRERYPHAVLTSSVGSAAAEPNLAHRTSHPGVEGLRSVLRTSAQALRPVAQIRVPVGDGRLLAELHRDGEVLSQSQSDGVVVVTARVEARLLGRLRRDGVEVVFGIQS
jgi:GTP-binding protein HflX